MATKKITITDWKVVGNHDNFTVLGMDLQHNVYYWKDGKWNPL